MFICITESYFECGIICRCHWFCEHVVWHSSLFFVIQVIEQDFPEQCEESSTKKIETEGSVWIKDILNSRIANCASFGIQQSLNKQIFWGWKRYELQSRRWKANWELNCRTSRSEFLKKKSKRNRFVIYIYV